MTGGGEHACLCEPEPAPIDRWEAYFQHILSHASPGQGHILSDSSSPVEKPTGAAFSGWKTQAAVAASAVGAVAGEMADVAQVTPLP